MTLAEFWSALNPWGLVLARMLTDIAWQSALLLAGMGILTWMLRKRSASLRHALWVTAILLIPLLPHLDIFFTSCDEARLIENTLGPASTNDTNDDSYILHFLDYLRSKSWAAPERVRLFGVTVSDGAWHIHSWPDGTVSKAVKTTSRFMDGEIVDLVGAGDAFRSGLITYIAKNVDAFKDGSINFDEAVQMGNLFASLYIKAPLDDRYAHISPFDEMLEKLRTAP